MPPQMRSHRLAVRTSPFHGGSPGSIPGGITKSKEASLNKLAFFMPAIYHRQPPQ